MLIPPLLNDVISLLLLLAPPAAFVSLVLAGMALRHDGSITFAIGGGFTKWMFWAVMFLTLQPLLTWFSSFGIAMPLATGGISTPWLANIQSDIASFVTKFIVGRIVPTLAAFFVLQAILDTACGEHPLPSIIAAMFLLGIQTTFSLIQGYDTQTQYATADVLDSLWNHLVGTIMPIAAVLALIGAILNFATRKPFMRLVAVALSLLCVSGIWQLLLAMMT
jgi:hypothetical protein